MTRSEIPSGAAALRERPPSSLRATDEAFRLLVDAVKDYGIFILDVDGNVVTWNLGAQRIKGYAAADVIGTHFSRFYTDDDRARHLPESLLAAARTHGRVEDEGWRVRQDGTRFWADVVITPIRDQAGVLLGYGKVTRDLTTRRQIESLKARENQMHEFLAMLSHELRNPLAPIVNALTLMRRTPADEHGKYRDIIERQASHLANIVNDLMDVGRLTRGKITLKKAVVDLNQVVLQAVEACQHLVDSRRHTIDLRLPDEPLNVEADLTRIVQVVVNIITNAVKYTPRGGRILISLMREDDQVALTIRDTGIGIPPAQLGRIFDLFVQGDRALDRSDAGLGIGLTVVRRLVKLHGGTVMAFSEGVDRGSEFVVRLPAVRDGSVVKSSAVHTGIAPVAARLRVLVVDDNQDFAATLAALIEGAGHQVRVAGDGFIAFGIALDYRPDVALVDIGLPGMSGFDLAQKFRESPALAATRLIAVTGYGQAKDRQRVKEAGFDRHLVKPVDPTQLLEVVGEQAAKR